MAWTFIVMALAAIAMVLIARNLGVRKGAAEATTWKLKARDPMNSTERKMFWRLQEALPEHVILAQVALSQLLEKPSNQGLWNKVDRKVLDFVICDANLRVIAIIETDGPHHRHSKQRKRDADKAAALDAAGYRLLRFKTEQLPTGAEVRSALGIDLYPTPDRAQAPVQSLPA